MAGTKIETSKVWKYPFPARFTSETGFKRLNWGYPGTHVVRDYVGYSPPKKKRKEERFDKL